MTEKIRRVLVTGGAGFIGSHLVEKLINDGQHVTVLDIKGQTNNLDQVKEAVGEALFNKRCKVITGDICNEADVQKALGKEGKRVKDVYHLAAKISVQESMLNPQEYNRVNQGGFNTVARLAVAAKVDKFIYASSAAVYGDSKALPNSESLIGAPLSTYAANKLNNEQMAQAYSAQQGVNTIFVGCRNFNVFGPRQDPNSGYSGVISKWGDSLIAGKECTVFGDGNQTRDFVYVGDVVGAMVSAQKTQLPGKSNIYNVGTGKSVTLLELYNELRNAVELYKPEAKSSELIHAAPKDGDIIHSAANVEKMAREVGFRAGVPFNVGIARTVAHFAMERGIEPNLGMHQERPADRAIEV